MLGTSESRLAGPQDPWAFVLFRVALGHEPGPLLAPPAPRARGFPLSRQTRRSNRRTTWFRDDPRRRRSSAMVVTGRGCRPAMELTSNGVDLWAVQAPPSTMTVAAGSRSGATPRRGRHATGYPPPGTARRGECGCRASPQAAGWPRRPARARPPSAPSFAEHVPPFASLRTDEGRRAVRAPLKGSPCTQRRATVHTPSSPPPPGARSSAPRNARARTRALGGRSVPNTEAVNP